jgi:hypothetical protein
LDRPELLELLIRFRICFFDFITFLIRQITGRDSSVQGRGNQLVAIIAYLNDCVITGDVHLILPKITHAPESSGK